MSQVCRTPDAEAKHRQHTCVGAGVDFDCSFYLDTYFGSNSNSNLKCDFLSDFSWLQLVKSDFNFAFSADVDVKPNTDSYTPTSTPMSTLTPTLGSNITSIPMPTLISAPMSTPTLTSSSIAVSAPIKSPRLTPTSAPLPVSTSTPTH